MGLSRRMPKSSINDVLAFVITELESSSRCLGYRAMHQKLQMNGFITDHEYAFDFERTWSSCVESRALHSLTRCTYISTDPNQTWHIDGYDRLKPFGFYSHGAINGYS